MRCLIVVSSLKRAGAETQAVDLANGLAERGHTVHLCSFEAELDQRNRLTDAVRFHHVLRRSKYDRSLVAAIGDIIDREQIEIVQGILQFSVLISWLAALRSQRRPPIVAAIHTTTNRGLKQELQDRLLYRWMLRRLPAVVFVCAYQRNHWLEKYPELGPTAQLVYNGIDINRFHRQDFEVPARKLRESLGISDTAFVFTCVAGFRPEKGHRLLIDAFTRQDSSAHLLLAGEGAGRHAIEADVKAAGLAGRVHFLGNVADVRPVIVASNATVLASTEVETFSIAMLESMALEVPMIASQIGGLAEAIVNGETGLIFPIGNVAALATGMRQMATTPEATRAMGQAAAAKVRESFTLEKMLIGSEAVLARVIQSKT